MNELKGITPMNKNRTKLKRFAFILSCIFILNMVTVPAEAGRRSRLFAITLLSSGLGLQVGSTFMNSSAQEAYDEYLSASLQADIQSRKSVVLERQNTSIIMSRVGLGCIGLAVLISIVDQLNSSSDTVPTETQIPTTADIISHYPSNLTSSDMDFGMYSGRVTRSKNMLPKFDFQAQTVYLQYTHRF